MEKVNSAANPCETTGFFVIETKKAVGYIRIGGALKVVVYKKPSRFAKFFMKWLLEFEYEDVLPTGRSPTRALD